jgi:hypothetical protein
MKKLEPNKDVTQKGTSSKVVWESYLWLLFVLQMLSWQALWAGQPKVFDYLDPNIKIPGWLAVWCFFRGQQIFDSQTWRWYLCGLLGWELVYGLLIVGGLTGTPIHPPELVYKPGFADLVVNFVLLAPYYFAIYRFSENNFPQGRSVSD